MFKETAQEEPRGSTDGDTAQPKIDSANSESKLAAENFVETKMQRDPTLRVLGVEVSNGALAANDTDVFQTAGTNLQSSSGAFSIASTPILMMTGVFVCRDVQNKHFLQIYPSFFYNVMTLCRSNYL